MIKKFLNISIDENTIPFISEKDFELYKKDFNIRVDNFIKEQRKIRNKTYELAKQIYLGNNNE